MSVQDVAGASEGERVRSPRRILVVDDEPDMLVNVARILRRGPYVCVTAGSGEEALALAERDQPDLIVSDLRMPGRDGLALLRALKQLSASTPVIIFTAYATDATAQEALAAGANAFLAKPFTATELLELVGVSLNGAGG
jgi:two-component system response regulator GlrR